VGCFFFLFDRDAFLYTSRGPTVSIFLALPFFVLKIHGGLLPHHGSFFSFRLPGLAGLFSDPVLFLPRALGFFFRGRFPGIAPPYCFFPFLIIRCFYGASFGMVWW